MHIYNANLNFEPKLMAKVKFFAMWILFLIILLVKNNNQYNHTNKKTLRKVSKINIS